MNMVYLNVLLLCTLVLVGKSNGGFISGEPCSERNTAYIEPTKTIYPLNNYRVKCVDITGMGIRRPIPDDLRLFTADSLYADHMNIRTLTPMIFQFLPYVELIDFTGNRIRKIPRTMNKLTPHLKTYLLGDNRIRVPRRGTLVRSHTLDTLMLSNNKIQSINYYTFAKLPRLRVLYLDGNALTYLTARMFENLKNLQYLHLGNNYLQFIPPKYQMPPKLKIYIVKGNERSNSTNVRIK